MKKFLSICLVVLPMIMFAQTRIVASVNGVNLESGDQIAAGSQVKFCLKNATTDSKFSASGATLYYKKPLDKIVTKVAGKTLTESVETGVIFNLPKSITTGDVVTFEFNEVLRTANSGKANSEQIAPFTLTIK
jgi:hypothetical protein